MQTAHSAASRVTNGGFALLRNPAGDILLIDRAGTVGPQRWQLPGGWLAARTPAPVVCRRTVDAQLGLTITPERVLAVHHLTDRTEGVLLAHDFDGGVVQADQSFALGAEVASCRWVPRDAVPYLVDAHLLWRVSSALAVLDGSRGGAADPAAAPGAPYLVGAGPIAVLAGRAAAPAAAAA
ncbi:NUDIX domain-containing protein [Streptomyces marincola]|uniref:NUDIX domain-containing protein n=1 Tax=Streptomyces marincola TaxID=2878388 RepID=UPI001CF53DE9|nr:NUDIX hydrolase [Streptomyces marincola]UCM88011.1 NUDIX hydrolase [Streptomyces marincola]